MMMLARMFLDGQKVIPYVFLPNALESVVGTSVEHLARVSGTIGKIAKRGNALGARERLWRKKKTSTSRNRSHDAEGCGSAIMLTLRPLSH